ncbi:MAG: hypothetical protein HC890_10065 [Chloroflexaceae bacterium]|nr:hypothetical protein [Chloroflexaceae bacterium]
MLDFYLTNAPLHSAQTTSADSAADWRVRATINGQSFLLDSWQPIYLSGFQRGNNWVKLEYIDGQGQAIANVFNNTARIITYEPGGQDTLSKLVRGELTVAEARGIVDPNYRPERSQNRPLGKKSYRRRLRREFLPPNYRKKRLRQSKKSRKRQFHR